MTHNVGTIDKVVRTILGLALLSLLFLLEGNARWWGVIGVVLLVTVFVSWCPAYAALGLKTTKSEQK